jgi:hypothetical protein
MRRAAMGVRFASLMIEPGGLTLTPSHAGPKLISLRRIQNALG